MRVRNVVTLLFSFLLVFSLLAFAQAKKAPPKMTFESKFGKVNFDHAQHDKAVKGECKQCHPKPWPEDMKAPLNFKGGAMHKTADAAKTSCAQCHHAGGSSFEVKGNCNKCHVKK